MARSRKLALAARAEAAVANISEASEDAGGRRLHVLIVDPEASFRQAIVDHVNELGHIASAFTNCTDAWATLQSVQVDVLIIDLETPALTALELARRAQKLHAAPVLLATSHNMSPKKRVGRHLAKAHGFYQVICKDVPQQNFENDVKVSILSAERLSEPRFVRLFSESSHVSSLVQPLAS